VLGLRSPEPSWYSGLWKRSNVVAGGPTVPVTVEAADARALHNELVQLGRELTQLGFLVTGLRVLADRDGAGGEAIPSVADQFAKAAAKFDQAATKCETTLKIEEAGTRRLATGSPSGPVTLSDDQVSSFQGRLMAMQRDVHDHLDPLLELSRVARSHPEQLQSRAGEFSQQPPRISALMTEFANDFDQTFGIVRATA
jgi:hypothetical protein